MTGSPFSTLNQVRLLGRLCHAPNVYLSKGNLLKAVFQIAVPRSSGRKDNNMISNWYSAQADFITVVLFGQPARDLCSRRLSRGTWLHVQGRLRTRSKRKWEVVAHSVLPAKVSEP